MEIGKTVIRDYEFIENRRKLYLIALEYLNRGLNQNNLSKAFESITESANRGFPYAINYLGNFYIRGLYVNKDLELGINYIKKAYTMKNPEAAYALYIFYSEGVHVNKDEIKALKYLGDAVDFACQEILKGEDLSLYLLKVGLGRSDQEISNFVEVQKAYPFCDICFESVQNKNIKTKERIRIEDIEDYYYLYPNAANMGLKASPLVENGRCCVECLINYVKPISKLFDQGYLSQDSIDEILAECDINERLEILEKVIQTNPLLGDFYHPQIIWLIERLNLANDIKLLLSKAKMTLRFIIENPRMVQQISTSSLLQLMHDLDNLGS